MTLTFGAVGNTYFRNMKLFSVFTIALLFAASISGEASANEWKKYTLRFEDDFELDETVSILIEARRPNGSTKGTVYQFSGPVALAEMRGEERLPATRVVIVGGFTIDGVGWVRHHEFFYRPEDGDILRISVAKGPRGIPNFRRVSHRATLR